MNMDGAFGILGSAGFLGGMAALLVVRHQIRKLRSEAHHLDVEAAVAEDRAEDDHTAALTARYREMIAEQTEALVKPLRTEVEVLRAEVSSLRTEVELVRTRYWRAISHIRSLMTWIHRHHTDPDSLPSAPAEISADI